VALLFGKNTSKAYLYASLTVLFWSTVATAFKIALREMSNVQMLLVANTTSLFVFLVVLIVNRKTADLRKTDVAGLCLSSLQGLLNPFAYYLILFKAYSILPAQVAQPANFVWPIVLMALSALLLKQPLRTKGVLALFISFIGILILSSQGDLRSFVVAEPLGVGLALLSSLVWALFWVLNLKDKRDNMSKLFFGSLFSTIYVLLLSYATGDVYDIFSKPIIPAIYIGFFEMGITYIVWLRALQLAESTGNISNFIYLTPFVSLIFIRFVLHEKLYYTSVIGLCFIVGGILVGQLKRSPE